ncbi:MAG: hypothetical protein K0S04_2778 [Herbinix sp.]|jgi:gamma-F420-2:alpha-L-glutamate ligase|nr:hypothetical protein [Herbinix sp.]
MLAWIIYHREAAIYNKEYIRFYIEEGIKLGIEIELVLVEELEFGVKGNRWFIKHQKEEVEYPDFAINRTIYPLLSRQLELLGIKVYNNSIVSEICNDKARTYQFLAKTGIAMVDSSFYQNAQIKEVLSRMDEPTVIKSVEGHGGQQVFLANPRIADCEELHSDVTNNIDGVPNNRNSNNMIQGLAHSDVVVQPLVGNKHQDLRVYVIGKEIVAAVLRTAKEGFKSNFSLDGEVELYELSAKERQLVQIIINQFDFGLVGIDFIIDDQGELIFNEIEDVVGSRMLYQCSQINIVERYLRYILRDLLSDEL